MGLFQLINSLLKRWKYSRDLKKATQFTEDTADGFWETFHLITTFHGRYRINKILRAAQQDEIYVDPKILGMYEFMMATVPYQMFSILN